MIRVTLPRTFIEDRADRDLPIGTVVKWAGRTVVLDLDAQTMADIRSDADYYSGPDRPDGWDGAASMARSAAATLRALDKAEVKS